MNSSAVLELLVDQYAAVPAPAPSAQLAARMDAGWIGSGDHDRGAVVVPFVARRRFRMRYLAAALVATFVAMSGLAVAGALPDPIQRGVASVVSHLGIDLPTPDTKSVSTPSDGGTGGHPSATNGTTPGGGSSPSGSSSTGGSRSGTDTKSGGGSSTTTTTRPGLGTIGNLGTPTVPPTTLPPGVDVPPVTVPPVTVPPIISVPQLSLSPPTLPTTTLPTTTLPPITVPTLPPLHLPGL